MRRGAVALVLSAGLAACGGTSEMERFRTEQLRPLQAHVEQDRAAVARIVQSLQVGNRSDARLLAAAIDRLAGRADEIRAFDPPEGAAVEAAAYATAIDHLAGRLREYGRAVAAGRRGAARAAATRSQQAVDELLRRRRELDRAVRADA